MTESGTNAVLLVRSAHISFALPLDQVIETMRPLPVQPLSDMPESVRGVSVIRGESVPVIDVACLLGGESREPTRYITVRAGGRTVAFAVDGSVSLATFLPADWGELPPLLREMRTEIIQRIGVVDRELSILLSTLRVVPDAVWAKLAREPGQ